jgi:hypothetical protein
MEINSVKTSRIAKSVIACIVLATTLVSVFSSFYVLKVDCSPPIVVEKPLASDQTGWHTVETWTFGITAFTVFVVRAIHYYAYISDQNDVKEAIARFLSWFLDKRRRSREKTISERQKIRRTATLKLKMLSSEVSKLVISLIASLATIIGIHAKIVVNFVLDKTGRILFSITMEI